MEMTHQTCRKCKRRLPSDHFNRDQSSKTGRRYICRICSKCEFANHKAQTEGNGGILHGADVWDLLDEQQWRCHYQGCELTLDNVVIDHYQPFADGGMNVIDNIVCSCNTCNNRKHAMPAEVAEKVLRSGGQLKYCKRCKRVLPIEHFRATGSQTFGREGWCRACNLRIKKRSRRKKKNVNQKMQDLLRGKI